MNIENMKKLRDYIAGLDPRLVRMHDYFGGEIRLNGHCGTVGCIAGHCRMMNGGSPAGNWWGGEVFEAAQRFLGLTVGDAKRLFYEMPAKFSKLPANPQTPRKREKEWVLRRLDRCIELGHVPSLHR